MKIAMQRRILHFYIFTWALFYGVFKKKIRG